MKHINIGDLVKKDELHTGWDDEYSCYVIDEDKVSKIIALILYSWALQCKCGLIKSLNCM